MIIDVRVGRYPKDGDTRGWVRYAWPGPGGSEALGAPVWVTGLKPRRIHVTLDPGPASGTPRTASVEQYIRELRQRAREFEARTR